MARGRPAGPGGRRCLSRDGVARPGSGDPCPHPSAVPARSQCQGATLAVVAACRNCGACCLRSLPCDGGCCSPLPALLLPALICRSSTCTPTLGASWSRTAGCGSIVSASQPVAGGHDAATATAGAGAGAGAVGERSDGCRRGLRGAHGCSASGRLPRTGQQPAAAAAAGELAGSHRRGGGTRPHPTHDTAAREPPRVSAGVTQRQRALAGVVHRERVGRLPSAYRWARRSGGRHHPHGGAVQHPEREQPPREQLECGLRPTAHDPGARHRRALADELHNSAGRGIPLTHVPSVHSHTRVCTLGLCV
eukprot:COSAG01_NODE_102_length_26290_cov_94.760299_9_plen_307_part_00